MSNSQDYYARLQISRTATLVEIKQAFRRLARQHHPDVRPGDPQAGELFQALVEAYNVLSDPAKRKDYDRRSDQSKDYSRRSQPTSPPTSQSTSSQNAGARSGQTAQGEAADSEKNPHFWYRSGVLKAQHRNYDGAIADFTEAVRLNPSFVDALIKRALAYSRVGEDRKVLEDCNLALKLRPDHAQAHFYLGRARHRLGYTQSAIEAFTQTIRWEPGHAQAFYQRGLAHQELREMGRTVEDLHRAAALFWEQGDRQGYHSAELALQNLKRLRVGPRLNPSETLIKGMGTLVGNTLHVTQRLVTNPAGGISSTFVRLNGAQASGVGMVFAIATVVLFVMATHTPWMTRVPLAWVRLAVVGSVPFCCLLLMGAIARGLVNDPNRWSGSIFVSGVSLFPVGILTLCSRWLPPFSSMWAFLSVLLVCASIFSLYNGCTQILFLPRAIAFFLVPIMLLTGVWFGYIAFIILFPPTSLLI